MPAEDRAKLLTLLATYAYEHRPEGFTLASGLTSTEYIDCRAALSHAEALAPLGRLVLDTLDDQLVAVGGLTMGADPVAISASLVSGRVGWFSVRKQPKSHGQKRMIEGDIPGGATIAVVDDVVTTGGSTVEAITKCREAGLKVAQVVILVDRQESGGVARIQREAGSEVPITALFTKSEVADHWRALGGNRRKTL